MTCPICGSPVLEGARFCSACGHSVTAAAPPHAGVKTRLFRPREGRMIAGVCAGFALQYGWDVVVVRLVLVLAAIFGAGAPLLAYLIAWIVMPNEQYSLPSATGVTPQ